MFLPQLKIPDTHLLPAWLFEYEEVVIFTVSIKYMQFTHERHFYVISFSIWAQGVGVTALLIQCMEKQRRNHKWRTEKYVKNFEEVENLSEEGSLFS